VGFLDDHRTQDQIKMVTSILDYLREMNRNPSEEEQRELLAFMDQQWNADEESSKAALVAYKASKSQQ
jgi:hypothetical protein